MTGATFLSRFTPSLLKPELLEAMFVQREKLAQRVTERIHTSATTENKHYFLLYGPRGIGKTHFVSLIYYRVKKIEDIQGSLLIAWLREEEWGVASYLDLLLSILRALKEEYQDAELEEKIREIRKLSFQEAERSAEEALISYIGGKTLLILAENLDEIFKGLEEIGQKKLRALFQNHPRFTVLATSQSLFEAVSEQSSPFYGFFEPRHLEELSLEDATLLLSKIAEQEGDFELVEMIHTPRGRARVRAMHHLAAGNPRVYVIFSQFLTTASLDELIQPVMHTLDDVTPYYQARMSSLSPQQRKIVEYLCDRRHAVPVGEIAQDCFISPQTASSQLKKLRELGYVRSSQAGRSSYYELKEPLMRMSMEVKKLRGEPIRLCVSFLRLWFSQDELSEKLAAMVEAGDSNVKYIAKALEMYSEEEDPIVVACENDLATYVSENKWPDSLQVLEELTSIRNVSHDWLLMSICFDMLGDLVSARKAFQRSSSVEPKTEFYFLLIKSDLAQNLIFRLLMELSLEVVSEYSGLVSRLLLGGRDVAVWQRIVEGWLRLFEEHSIIEALGQSLVESLRVLVRDDFSQQDRERWRDLWVELASGYPEMTVPLRLLDVGVRFLEARDPRVLFDLPMEERSILAPLVGAADLLEAGSAS